MSCTPSFSIGCCCYSLYASAKKKEGKKKEKNFLFVCFLFELEHDYCKYQFGYCMRQYTIPTVLETRGEGGYQPWLCSAVKWQLLPSWACKWWRLLATLFTFWFHAEAWVTWISPLDDYFALWTSFIHSSSRVAATQAISAAPHVNNWESIYSLGVCFTSGCSILFTVPWAHEQFYCET